jgi:RND family efflux transporter MFP subunit
MEEIGDTSDFTGRTEAVESVEIKARATGYLEKVFFKEGELVKKGEILYKIDDRTYKAELDRLEGEIERQQATLARMNSDLARARRMRVGDAVSREEFDKITTSKDEAAAVMASAKAAAKRARLDLEFTTVYSPIDGQISRTRITKGNLVTQDQTLLTTVRTIDPIYALFDVDEHTVLEVQKKIREGKFKGYREAEFPLFLGTQIEKGYPHKGFIDFADNTLDPSTATLRIRGEFPNKDGVLVPGLFVRIRVPLGNKRKALVVSERALGSDQGQRFLYVVSDKNKVEYRPVEVGLLRDGMRVLESGAKAGEWVIVNGLQRVRDGVTVDPQKVKMPRPLAAPAPAVKGNDK